MMKNTKKFGAFAAMAAAVVCACEVQATPIDWNAVSSKTYTVPADTTNEVLTAEEFVKVTNLLTKVIFANGNSTLRFTTPTFPDSVTFQGPGTVLMDENVVLDKPYSDANKQYTYLRRSLGTGDTTNFVKFVFAKDIENSTPESIQYLRVAPDYLPNAVISFNGTMATNVYMHSTANARFDLGESFSISNSAHMNSVLGMFGVLRQRGCDIKQYGISGDGPSISSYDRVGAWLMEGGSYYVENAGKYSCFYGYYSHVRQTGGLFSFGRFAVNSIGTSGIRSDFVFGGTGEVNIRGKSCPERQVLFAFMDSVDFKNPYSASYYWYNYSGSNKGGNCEGTIWAHNGGIANYAFYPLWDTDAGNKNSGPTNNVFSFNGGMRGYRGNYAGLDTNDTCAVSFFGYTPWVRVYEKGGGILIDRANTSYYLSKFELREPEGNVIKSIELSDELRNKVWQYPPAVEIWDEGGTGTNAAAVVDYDFDTGRITNFTIACKGENYTAPKVNLRYKRGDRLLTENLNCIIGPEQGGDFTFAATNRGVEISLTCFTNYCHGTLVVDMDRLGLADHGAYTKDKWNNFLHMHYIHNGTVARAEQAVKNSYFPNMTNIVLKSGGLDSYNNEGGWGYNHTHNPCGILPKCWRLELYGGHMTGGSIRFEDVVIGGEVWLRSHQSGDSTREGDIRICRTRSSSDDWQDCPGMLTVDVACLTNGITPKVKYGNVRFYCGNENTTLPALAGRTNSVVTVKNWECILKRRDWTTILDLTETTVNVPSSSTVPTPLGHRVSVPDIVYPEGSEGKFLIKWEMNPSDATKPYKLLSRRVVNGTVLIFR